MLPTTHRLFLSFRIQRQESFGAIFALGIMLQSVDSSAMIALAYGMIASIALPHGRASFVGAAQGGCKAAPALASVIAIGLEPHCAC